MLDRRKFLGSALATALFGAAKAKSAPATTLTPVRRGQMPPPVFQDDESYWRTLRQEFTIPADEAFFNTGTMGASPRVVQDAVFDHMRMKDATIAHWDYRPEHPDYFTGYRPELDLRTKLAALVGADPDEIALTQNATFGANYMANGLALRPGDEVIMTNQEHVGCESPWQLRAKRFGLYIKKVTVPTPPDNPQQLIDLFANASTPQTRVWAIPHLTSGTAVKFPVAQLCALARQRNILSVVDGAQCCGNMVLDLHAMGCDAYFSSPHKWLLAPAGSGFLYVRRELMPDVWASVVSGSWDDYHDGALRFFQNGTGSLSSLKGYEAAVDFHNRIGKERVAARIMMLADRLRAGLAQIPSVHLVSPVHPELTSATTIWGLQGWTSGDLMDALWNRAKVRCRAVGPGVRQCCHIYNSPAEVDRTLATARQLAAEHHT